MHGDHVHEAVIAAFKKGHLHASAVTMHFVTDTEGYDKGPIIMRRSLELRAGETVDSLKARINKLEHRIQPIVTDLVMNGDIHWSESRSDPVVLPRSFPRDQHVIDI